MDCSGARVFASMRRNRILARGEANEKIRSPQHQGRKMLDEWSKYGLAVRLQSEGPLMTHALISPASGVAQPNQILNGRNDPCKDYTIQVLRMPNG